MFRLSTKHSHNNNPEAFWPGFHPCAPAYMPQSQNPRKRPDQGTTLILMITCRDSCVLTCQGGTTGRVNLREMDSAVPADTQVQLPGRGASASIGLHFLQAKKGRIIAEGSFGGDGGRVGKSRE